MKRTWFLRVVLLVLLLALLIPVTKLAEAKSFSVAGDWLLSFSGGRDGTSQNVVPSTVRVHIVPSASAGNLPVSPEEPSGSCILSGHTIHMEMRYEPSVNGQGGSVSLDGSLESGGDNMSGAALDSQGDSFTWTAVRLVDGSLPPGVAPGITSSLSNHKTADWWLIGSMAAAIAAIMTILWNTLRPGGKKTWKASDKK